MKESIESVQSNREQLQKLEAENKYVFHGSGSPNLDSLEPRQAFNYINGVHVPDGDPAVFASSKADYAILMALINERNCPDGYQSSAGASGNENGEIILNLSVRKDALEQLSDDSLGYVYVFNKGDFVQREEMSAEFVSKVSVTPVSKIVVKKSDLPPCVEVF